MLVHLWQSRGKERIVDQIHQLLSNAGIAFVDCGGVVPNPRLELAEEAVELGKREGVDFYFGHRWRICHGFCQGTAYGLANDVSLEDLYLHKVVSKVALLALLLLLQELDLETGFFRHEHYAG